MTLRRQGSDPNQWHDQSPNGSRLSGSTVSAAQPATPDGCGMGLTPYSGVIGRYQLLAVPSPLSATGGVR
jgi:hypothetical protein